MKTVVSVKVDTEVKDKLRQQAKDNGMTFNQMMEDIIETLLYLSGSVSVYEYLRETAEFSRILNE